MSDLESDVDDYESGTESEVEETEEESEQEGEQYNEEEAGIQIRKSINRIPDTERITTGTLTIFEMTRVIGTRAQEIAVGSRPLIEFNENMDPIEIATEELKQRKIPYIIRRLINPSGNKYEEFRVKDLQLQMFQN